MVVAGKIFRLVELTPLPELATKLSGYGREEPYEEGDYKFTLVTEIMNLLPRENAVVGIYSHDYVLHVFIEARLCPFPELLKPYSALPSRKSSCF